MRVKEKYKNENYCRYKGILQNSKKMVYVYQYLLYYYREILFTNWSHYIIYIPVNYILE